MTARSLGRLALGAALAVLVHASSARAQHAAPTLRAEGGANVMLSERYRDRFDWGFGGTLRLGIAMSFPLELQVGVGALRVPVPGQDPGTLYAFTFGARSFIPLRDEGFVGGPALDVNAGVGLTGDLVRAVFDAGIGWDFRAHPKVYFGPVVRYRRIFQPQSQTVSTDAQLLELGVSVTFRFERTEPAPVTETAPVDTDGDGITDDRDGCPAHAEDVDGYSDEDGCPDPDDDADGFADDADRCPHAAETRNGFDDEDGCPDETAVAAQTTSEAPAEAAEHLDETMQFDVDSASMRPSSRREFEAICARMRASTNLRIRVIGHADERGTQAGNHLLGARRAGTVSAALVRCGVDAHRIESMSYGDTTTTCTEDAEHCHARNRRVEFEVYRHDAQPRSAE